MQMLVTYEFLIGVFLRAGSSLMSVYIKKKAFQTGRHCTKCLGTIYSNLRNKNECFVHFEIVKASIFI